MHSVKENHNNVHQKTETQQIITEFKARALACHPDKHPGNIKAVQDFQMLQEAKDVLTDETKRKKYDFWLRSRVAVPFSDWQAFGDSVKISMHWAARTKKEPMLEAPEDKSEVRTVIQPDQSDGQRPINGVSFDEHLYSSHYCHHDFRGTGDCPSSLLQKFRNYEI